MSERMGISIMSNTYNMLLAGFGGQGVLFAGKLIISAGIKEGKQVTWLPSYGPEMRGGTANCSVIVSDNEVASPLVVKPDVLLAMNLPSLDKFEDIVAPGGIIIVDSSLVEKKVKRTDVKAYYLPATKMAIENDLKGLANVIMVGKIALETKFVSIDTIEAAIRSSISEKKIHLLEPNIKAVKLGYEFV